MTDESRARVRRVHDRLVDPEPEVRRLATKDLPELPTDEAVSALRKALGDPDWRVRKEAAAVSARVPARTAVVIVLVRLLSDAIDVGRRNAAVEGLIAVGPDAVPAVIDALDRLDADGRKLAIEVLAGAPTLAGMRAVATALADPDANVVIAAAEALGQAPMAGEEARDLARSSLVSMLASPEPGVRLASLISLGRVGAELPWSDLESLVVDPILRRHAIAAAAGQTTPRALRGLAEAASDDNPTVAREAVAALGRSVELLWGDDEALAVVVPSLRAGATHATLRRLADDEDDSEARSSALLALGLVRDPDDVSLLARALADDTVADHAEAALRLFGQDAMEPLLAEGRGSAESLRAIALSVAPPCASQDADNIHEFVSSEPLTVLREALASTSPDVVVAALKSLAVLGSSVDLGLVAERIHEADPGTVGALHSALVSLATRHLDHARSLVEEADPHSKGALAATIVLDVLARHGRSTREDAPFLVRALAHRDPLVRQRAIDALARAGGAEAEAAVAMSLADEDPRVADAAIRALGRLGRADSLAVLAATTRPSPRLAVILRALHEADVERAVAVARSLLSSTEASVAAAAVEVLAAVTAGEERDVLLGAIDHPDHEVVKLALARLTHGGRAAGIAALARALDHEAEAVRRYAAELLGQTGDREAEELLRARFAREPSLDVRRAIMDALSACGPGDAL